jgi:hypothetical protein
MKGQEQEILFKVYPKVERVLEARKPKVLSTCYKHNGTLNYKETTYTRSSKHRKSCNNNGTVAKSFKKGSSFLKKINIQNMMI